MTTTNPDPLLALSIDQQARDLFAAEYERDGIEFLPGEIRKPNSMMTMFENRAIRAIKVALTQHAVALRVIDDLRAANARGDGVDELREVLRRVRVMIIHSDAEYLSMDADGKVGLGEFIDNALNQSAPGSEVRS